LIFPYHIKNEIGIASNEISLSGFKNPGLALFPGKLDQNIKLSEETKISNFQS
jgi:hypothetical protein